MRCTGIQFKNLFIIIFVSYIIVLLIPLLMTAAIYLRSENVVKDKIIESNFALLRQIQRTVDDRLNEIDQLSNQIVINPRTVKLMYTSGELNRNKRLDVVNLLKDYSSYKNISPFIEEFFVYFYNIDYLVTSTSSCTPDFYYKNFIDSEDTYGYWKDTVLQSMHSGDFIRMKVKLSSRESKNVLCFLKSLPDMVNAKPMGNISIIVDFSKLKDLLASAEEINGGMAFVLDKYDEIFFSSPNATEYLPVDVSLFKEERGELEQVVNDMEYVFAYMKSEDSGLTYVTAFPRNIIQAEINYMRRFMQIAIYICVFIALVLILILTYRSYRPIQNIARQFGQDTEQIKESNAFLYIEHAVERITNKNQQFKEEMKRYRPLFRSTFLLKLIKGSTMKETELAEAAESYDIRFQYENITAVLIHIDDCSRFIKDNSEEERNYIRLIVGNISEELASSIGFGCTVEVEADTFCLIMNFDSKNIEKSHEEIAVIVERIKYEIETNFQIVMTISIGKIGNGISAIHSSYLDAMDALDYRMIKGTSSIIFADELNRTSSNYHYPAEVENHLINYIKSGEYISAKKLINELFTENFLHRKLSLPVGKCLFFDIISTVIKVLDQIEPNHDVIFGKYNPIEKLLQCETIYQAQNVLFFVFKKICDYVNTNKRSHNNELKEELLRYIDKTYRDESLCQTMIAEHFNISTNYLSNFFHEQVGEKMSYYISSIRVKKTRELLRDTELNIRKIAKEVGFGSDLSLIRVFKKIEGLTPGQYRNQVRKK